MSIHPIFAQALKPFAPKNSSIHQEPDWVQVDLQANQNKAERAVRENEKRALAIQQRTFNAWGIDQ